MSAHLTIWTLILMLFCVITDVGRELNFKAATLRADRDRYVVSLLTHPFLWMGLVLWAVELIAWLLVLERAPLAVAFPVMALTYAGTPLAAGFLLRESLSRGQRTGALLVTVGVLVVSLSELRG